MRLKKNWVAFYTLFRREYIRIMRIWPQTILPPIITTSIYYVIFGEIMGPRIGDINGVPYIQYIVPGLVMMAIITNAYTNVVTSFYLNKFQRNVEEMLVSPMPNYTILAGYVGGGVMRSMLVGFLVSMVSLLFYEMPIYSWVLTLIFSVCTAVLFSLAGFVNGIFAKSFDAISIVPTFVITPLTYLAGVFYSTELLKGFWRTLTFFNPIFYLVDGFRYGILGQSEVAIEYTLLAMITMVLGLYSFSIWLLNRGVGLRT